MNFAKDEAQLNNVINFFEMPGTKYLIEQANPGVPVKVEGLRTWSNPKHRSYAYLITWFNPDTWKEEMLKLKLDK